MAVARFGNCSCRIVLKMVLGNCWWIENAKSKESLIFRSCDICTSLFECLMLIREVLPVSHSYRDEEMSFTSVLRLVVSPDRASSLVLNSTAIELAIFKRFRMGDLRRGPQRA